MSRKKYVELLEEFCALTGADDPARIIRDAALTVNGVAFSFIHEEEIDPALLTVYADFGKLPSKRELEVCMGLMEANLSLAAQRFPIFGISPNTRNVTLAAQCQLADLDPENLRSMLVELAAKAQEWQEKNLLGLKPNTPPKRGNFNWLGFAPVKS